MPARVKLAEALLEAGNIERSQRLFDALRRVPESEAAAELGLGRIAAAEGHHEEAVAHLQRAVTLFPEWGAAHYALALSYRALGRREDAQRALEQHARFGPRWPAIADPVLATVTSLRDDAQTNLQRGLKLADAGDVAGAIAAHEAALALDPSIAQAHANLVVLYGRARDWPKAEAHYRTVVALGFNLADAHYDYGVLLGLQQRWEDAADAYRKAIAVNPRHAGAHNNLGQILERQQKIDAAAAAYRQAVTRSHVPAGAVQSRTDADRPVGPDDAIVELEKLTEPRDADAPPDTVCLGDRPRARGPP